MTRKAKDRFMAATCAVALLAAVAWSYGRLSDSRAAATDTARDLAECRSLIDHIHALRARPTVAGAHELAAADLSSRVGRAAQSAELDESNVERIEPEPPRRIGDTDYRELATQIRLRGASLKQVFAFFHALGSAPLPSGTLRLRDIRLTAPRGDETSDHWAVESAIAYTVYAPRAAEAANHPAPAD